MLEVVTPVDDVAAVAVDEGTQIRRDDLSVVDDERTVLEIA